MSSSEFFVDTLPNGVRLVTVPLPHLHAAELVCYLAVGGRNEADEISGVSHFLEHMVFRGTEEYPTSTDIERAFEAIGGAVNASTDVENTCFHSRVHPAYLAEGLALFASMLLRPKFRELDVERRIILEEAREDFNEEGTQVNPDNLMAELLWPGHPLGKSLIGTPESLAGIDLPRLEAYYRSWYRPQNLVICACGPLSRDEFRSAATREFGHWTPAPLPALSPAPQPEEAQPESCWVDDSDSQVSLQLAFRLPGRSDERILAVRLLRRLLSWGGGARLPLRLREELGLTYSVEANCSLLSDTGYLSIDLSVAPANLPRVLPELFDVLADLRNNRLPQAELDAAIKGYLFDLEFSQDQSDSLAVRYGWGLQAGYLRTLEQDRLELQQLTCEKIQQAACELLTRQSMKLVVVGPWREQDRSLVEKQLHAAPF